MSELKHRPPKEHERKARGAREFGRARTVRSLGDIAIKGRSPSAILRVNERRPYGRMATATTIRAALRLFEPGGVGMSAHQGRLLGLRELPRLRFWLPGLERPDDPARGRTSTSSVDTTGACEFCAGQLRGSLRRLP